MNNPEVDRLIMDCEFELNQLQTLIDGLGMGSNIVPYLTKYALIKACGTIEVSFKAIIADYCSKRTKKQIKRFLSRRVREDSSNPTYSNICSLVKDFDEDWQAAFKAAIDANPDKAKVLDHLQSLVDNRNDFSHGGSPKVTMPDVITYFADAKTVIASLDAVVA